MVRVAECIRVIGHTDGGEAARREAGSGHNDVYRTQGETLVDVRLFSELRRWIDVDLVPSVGALGEFLRGPDGLSMQRFGGRVHVRPFEPRLCCSASGEKR